MNDTASILQLLTPKAALKAMTPETKSCVPQGFLEHGFISIKQFPFSVGRESRIKEVHGKLIRTERMKFSDHEPSNDIYLTDVIHPLNISREHFTITQTQEGYEVIDRYSACGTSVGRTHIGGNDSGGSIKLQDGDIIAVGAVDTPYLFEFMTF